MVVHGVHGIHANHDQFMSFRAPPTRPPLIPTPRRAARGISSESPTNPTGDSSRRRGGGGASTSGRAAAAPAPSIVEGVGMTWKCMVVHGVHGIHANHDQFMSFRAPPTPLPDRPTPAWAARGIPHASPCHSERRPPLAVSCQHLDWRREESPMIIHDQATEIPHAARRGTSGDRVNRRGVRNDMEAMETLYIQRLPFHPPPQNAYCTICVSISIPRRSTTIRKPRSARSSRSAASSPVGGCSSQNTQVMLAS